MREFIRKRNAAFGVQDHSEAIRLAWKSRHFPFGTILLVTLMLGGVLPTVLTIITQGPVNPIP